MGSSSTPELRARKLCCIDDQNCICSHSTIPNGLSTRPCIRSSIYIYIEKSEKKIVLETAASYWPRDPYDKHEQMHNRAGVDL